jgi:predicted membrane-bound spermidine synthase
VLGGGDGLVGVELLDRHDVELVAAPPLDPGVLLVQRHALSIDGEEVESSWGVEGVVVEMGAAAVAVVVEAAVESGVVWVAAVLVIRKRRRMSRAK